MEDTIATLINAKGSDRTKVQELLQEYLIINRHESEVSSDSDERGSEQSDANNDEVTNSEDDDDFEADLSDFEHVMRNAETSGDIVTNDNAVEYQKAAAFRY